MNRFKLLTYNIHKGFNISNRRFVLGQIKNSIEEIQADILCLQEVIGAHTQYEHKIKN